MALFQFSSAQFEELKKLQAQQTNVIQTGFASLIAALTGADVAEIQQRINTLAEVAKTEADALEQTATKGEGE